MMTERENGNQSNEDCNLCTLVRPRDGERQSGTGAQPLNPAYPLAPSVSGLGDSSRPCDLAM